MKMTMMTMTLAHQSQELGICANVNISNSGVGMESTTNKNADVNRVDEPQKLDSDFGDVPYWSNITIATDVESYMPSIIATYGNMDNVGPILSMASE